MNDGKKQRRTNPEDILVDQIRNRICGKVRQSNAKQSLIYICQGECCLYLLTLQVQWGLITISLILGSKQARMGVHQVAISIQGNRTV